MAINDTHTSCVGSGVKLRRMVGIRHRLKQHPQDIIHFTSLRNSISIVCPPPPPPPPPIT